tara:strand:+ start:346 stop:609 length:264 start_codon:yes stop_codon:yes gene_type:complete
MIGDKEAVRFELTELADSLAQMNDEESSAIRYGVDKVVGKSAKEASKESHDGSRVWRSSPDGAELNIYADMSPDDEYEAVSKALVRS